LFSQQVVESTLEATAGAFDPAHLRVGADLVEIEQVAASVARFGDRFVRRVYTDHELSCCQGAPSVLAAGLAGRFAAKEATIKVLRPAEVRPDWRSIEVWRHPGGWCELRLTGEAKRLSDEAGIRSMAVSLSHEAGMAGAVVVAVCDRPEP